MVNQMDDLDSVLDKLDVTRKKIPFKINHLKIEHFYWNADDIEPGMPKSTSIELICNYNHITDNLEWKRKVSHTYVSLEDSNDCTTDSYIEDVENATDIISEIENYDLRELKNNYFTDDVPQKFTHWELTYNNYFKISGTYDQEIAEITKISEILNFKKIMDIETKKIKQKIGNM